MDSNPRLQPCGTQGWIRIRDGYVVLRDGVELETVMWYSGMDWTRDCHVELRDGFESETAMWYSGMDSNLNAAMWYIPRNRLESETAAMWYAGMDSNPRLLCGTQGWIWTRDCHVVLRDGFESETAKWYSGMDSNPRLPCGTQGWIWTQDCHVVLTTQGWVRTRDCSQYSWMSSRSVRVKMLDSEYN